MVCEIYYFSINSREMSCSPMLLKVKSQKVDIISGLVRGGFYEKTCITQNKKISYPNLNIKFL